MGQKSILRIFFLWVALSVSVVQAGDFLVPGDNLIIDGIPPISSEILEQSKAYANLGALTSSFSSWHPLRKELLVLSLAGETQQIHYIKNPLGKKIQLTSFVDRIGEVNFHPSGDYFVFNKDTGGGEWYQNYRFDLDTQKITPLTESKASGEKKSKNTLGVWSRDGKKMAYSSSRRNGKDLDFYVIDPLNPLNDQMVAELHQGEGWKILDWSPDDQKLLALEYKSINESNLWIFDLQTGTQKRLTPAQSQDAQDQVAYANAQYSLDGKSVFTTTDRDSEFLRLAKIDIETGQFEYFSNHASWDIEYFHLSPNGEKIAYLVNQAGRSILHLLDISSKTDQVLDGIPMGVVSKLSWHPSGDSLGFNLSSARSVSDVYSYEISTQRLVRWTQGTAVGLDIDQFVEPELVEWKSFDGLMISGFLYSPKVDQFPGKRPVVVSIHGGPESQSRPIFLGRLNYYLNELGVAVLLPNVRGSAGYGKKFLLLDNGYLRENSYKDIGALLDWIKNRPQLDSNKIMITGGSYGGHMTLAVATLYSNQIACSVEVVGMSNLVTFLERTESYRQDLRRAEYGDERDPEMRAFLEKIAPINHVDQITKPLFIVQGQNDPRVPYTEAEQMLAAMQKQNTPVWYLMAKDEGHGFSKRKNQNFQFYSTVLFMKQYLLGND